MFDFILQLGIMDIKLEEGEAGSIIHLVSRISAALPGPSCSKHCRHNKVISLCFFKSNSTHKTNCCNIFCCKIVRSFCTAKASHIF